MRSGFLLLAALVLAVLPSQAADTYRTYINARYGTVVQYPANLLMPRPEPDNGDGRRFVSPDGAVELMVYASYNALDRTVKGQMANAIADWKHDGARLTYQKSGPGWYALSGFADDDIFYEKTLYRNGAFHTLIWQYPQRLKARLDAAVNLSVRTFTVGKTVVTSVTTPAPAKTKPTPRPARRRPSRPVRKPTPAPPASSQAGY